MITAASSAMGPRSMPLSATASRAAATASCVGRLVRRASLWPRRAAGSKPLTSPAHCEGRSDGSKAVIRATPLRPARKASQVDGRSWPTGDTQPMPVTTTRTPFTRRGPARRRRRAAFWPPNPDALTSTDRQGPGRGQPITWSRAQSGSTWSGSRPRVAGSTPWWRARAATSTPNAPAAPSPWPRADLGAVTASPGCRRRTPPAGPGPRPRRPGAWRWRGRRGRRPRPAPRPRRPTPGPWPPPPPAPRDGARPRGGRRPRSRRRPPRPAPAPPGPRARSSRSSTKTAAPSDATIPSRRTS